MLATLGLFAAVVALAPPRVVTVEPEPLGPRPPVFAGTQLDYKFDRAWPDATPDTTDRNLVLGPPTTPDRVRISADLLATGFSGDPHIFLARPDPRGFVDMMLSGITTLLGSISA